LTYNEKGLETFTDPLSGVTAYGYDSAGRLQWVTNALENVFQLVYGSNYTTLIDPRTNKTTFVYDIYGHTIRQTNANGVCAITNGYDANGRLTRQWTKNGTIRDYQYDPRGLLTNIVYASTNIAFGYDYAGNLTSMADRSGQTTFTWAGQEPFSYRLAS